MYADEIEKTVAQTVAEVAEKSEQEIWEKRNLHLFKEVGLDSLLALEIIAMLERKYKISVPEERIVDLATLNDAINLVKETLKQDGKLEAFQQKQ